MTSSIIGGKRVPWCEPSGINFSIYGWSVLHATWSMPTFIRSNAMLGRSSRCCWRRSQYISWAVSTTDKITQWGRSSPGDASTNMRWYISGWRMAWRQWRRPVGWRSKTGRRATCSGSWLTTMRSGCCPSSGNGTERNWADNCLAL